MSAFPVRGFRGDGPARLAGHLVSTASAPDPSHARPCLAAGPIGVPGANGGDPLPAHRCPGGNGNHSQLDWGCASVVPTYGKVALGVLGRPIGHTLVTLLPGCESRGSPRCPAPMIGSRKCGHRKASWQAGWTAYNYTPAMGTKGSTSPVSPALTVLATSDPTSRIDGSAWFGFVASLQPGGQSVLAIG